MVIQNTHNTIVNIKIKKRNDNVEKEEKNKGAFSIAINIAF